MRIKMSKLTISLLVIAAFLIFAPNVQAGCCVEAPIGSPGLNYCRRMDNDLNCQDGGGNIELWRDANCSAVEECTDTGKCLYGANKCADEMRWQCDQRGGVASVDFFPGQSCGAQQAAGFCCVTRSGDTTVCYDATTFPRTQDRVTCESRADVVRFEASKTCSSIVECSQASPPPAPAPAQPASSPPIVPRLQINIPGVSFSQPAQEGGFLSLPFLADYLSGVYKYLISIAGVLAGIMLTIGGVQYLMAAGNKSGIDTALKRIKNALIGLVIAFGSYIILFTINPQLVSFKSLRIETVRPQTLQLVSTIDEGEGDMDEPSSGGSFGGGVGFIGAQRAQCAPLLEAAHSTPCAIGTPFPSPTGGGVACNYHTAQGFAHTPALYGTAQLNTIFGIDIGGGPGQQIKAPFSGRVQIFETTGADCNPRCDMEKVFGGQKVGLIGEGGVQLGIAHVSSFLVQNGAVVTKGQPIATVGGRCCSEYNTEEWKLKTSYDHRTGDDGHRNGAFNPATGRNFNHYWSSQCIFSQPCDPPWKVGNSAGTHSHIAISKNGRKIPILSCIQGIGPGQ